MNIRSMRGPGFALSGLVDVYVNRTQDVVLGYPILLLWGNIPAQSGNSIGAEWA